MRVEGPHHYKVTTVLGSCVVWPSNHAKVYVRGKPTASSLSTDGFPLMAGPNFQPSDGNPTVISILRQLADGPENVPEM